MFLLAQDDPVVKLFVDRTYVLLIERMFYTGGEGEGVLQPV